MTQSTKNPSPPRQESLKRAAELLDEQGSIQRDLEDLTRRKDSVVLDLDEVFRHLFGCFFGEATQDQIRQVYAELQDFEVFGDLSSGQVEGMTPISLSDAGMPISRDVATTRAKEEICTACGAREDPAIGCRDCHLEIPEDAIQKHMKPLYLPTNENREISPKDPEGNRRDLAETEGSKR